MIDFSHEHLHHFSRGWPRITTIVAIIFVSAKRNPANSRSRRLTTDRSFDLALIQSVCVSTRRPGPGEQNPPREYWCAVSAAGGGGGRSRMRAGKKGGGGWPRDERCVVLKQSEDIIRRIGRLPECRKPTCESRSAETSVIAKKIDGKSRTFYRLLPTVHATRSCAETLLGNRILSPPPSPPKLERSLESFDTIPLSKSPGIWPRSARHSSTFSLFLLFLVKL